MEQYRTFLKLRVVFVLILAICGLAAQRTSAQPMQSPAAPIVITPGATNVRLPEIDEFATTVMADPWDMNEPTDITYFRMGVNNAAFANGIFSGQMAAGDGSVALRLLSVIAPNHTAMRVGKTGYNYPIDASRYRWLAFRMYSGNATNSSGYVQWFTDDTYTTGGRSQFFSVPANGWTTYVIDLANAVPTNSWSGTIRELTIHPMGGTGVQDATIKLDWVRLTAQDPRASRPFIIQWSNASGSQVTLYANPDNTTYDANKTVPIGIVSNNGSYIFQTGVLPAGKYYIGVKDSSGVITWSTGALILNAPPQVVITKPSMTSGQDFATTELRNPWDMSSMTAINYNLKDWEVSSKCVTNESFTNGIYTAQVPPNCPAGSNYSDPLLYLGGIPGSSGNTYPSIDPSKYRYMSYRYFHSGQQNIAEGWIARIGWWADGTVSPSQSARVSRDIIIYEGWNTYKVDLWASDFLDESYPAGSRSWPDSHPNRLRFDPDELAASLAPATIQLDWIKLTTMDEVQQGSPFPIEYTINSALPVTLTFYYDTDQNPANGRTQIGVSTLMSTMSMPAQAIGDTVAQTLVLSASDLANRIYLPLVMRNYLSCSGVCYVWNTAGVAKGTYYVCVNSQDAYNVMYRCSEAPVVIK